MKNAEAIREAPGLERTSLDDVWSRVDDVMRQLQDMQENINEVETSQLTRDAAVMRKLETLEKLVRYPEISAVSTTRRVLNHS